MKILFSNFHNFRQFSRVLGGKNIFSILIFLRLFLILSPGWTCREYCRVKAHSFRRILHSGGNGGFRWGNTFSFKCLGKLADVSRCSSWSLSFAEWNLLVTIRDRWKLFLRCKESGRQLPAIARNRPTTEGCEFPGVARTAPTLSLPSIVGLH